MQDTGPCTEPLPQAHASGTCLLLTGRAARVLHSSVLLEVTPHLAHLMFLKTMNVVTGRLAYGSVAYYTEV